MNRTLLFGAITLALIATSSLGLAQQPVDPPPAAPSPEAPPTDDAATEPVAAPDASPPPSNPAPPPPPVPAEPPPAAPTDAVPTDAVAASSEATASTEAGAAVGVSADPGALDMPGPQSTETSTREESWFARAPVAITLGGPERQLELTFYGILQADFIHDTTRSYNESIGTSLVARGDTYEGTRGRSQATMRNTRLGLNFATSTIGPVTPSAVFEGDFAGNQPNEIRQSSEARYYDSPAFRIRKAYFKLRSDYVDLLFGQTYDLFARQESFDPGARHTQIRASHAFGADGPISFEVAAAAQRPVQRDAQLPDGAAALRLNVNSWKGIATPRGLPKARALSFGVSAVARQFDVDAFTPPPTQTSNRLTAWGLAADALVPVIPAEDKNDRGNKLTLKGSFVIGTGIGDLAGATGGAMFTPLPNPARANPPPEYDPNVDEGLVAFDTQGVLATIDWRVIRIGAEYYLPPRGRVMLAANFSQSFSENIPGLFPRGGAEIELLTHVADRTHYVDAKLAWYATPEVRFGLEGAYTTVMYLDGENPDNYRAKVSGMYYF